MPVGRWLCPLKIGINKPENIHTVHSALERNSSQALVFECHEMRHRLSSHQVRHAEGTSVAPVVTHKLEMSEFKLLYLLHQHTGRLDHLQPSCMQTDHVLPTPFNATTLSSGITWLQP